MKKFLKGFRIFFALFFAILFIASTLLALTIYNFEQKLLDADTIRHAIQDNNLYGQVHDIFIQIIITQIETNEDNGVAVLLMKLPPEEKELILVTLLSQDDIKKLVDGIVTQLIGFLNGENAYVESSLIGIQNNVKTQLGDPTLKQGISNLLDSQSECTIDQLEQIVNDRQTLIVCNPPSSYNGIELQPITDTQIETQIQALNILFPSKIIIVPADSNLLKMQAKLQEMRQLLRFSFLFPLTCLLIVTILVVDSLKGWFGWWGFPLLIAGGLGIYFSNYIRSIYLLLYGSVISVYLPSSIPSEISTSIKNVVGSVIQKALQPMTQQASILLIIGSILVTGMVVRIYSPSESR